MHLHTAGGFHAGAFLRNADGLYSEGAGKVLIMCIDATDWFAASHGRVAVLVRWCCDRLARPSSLLRVGSQASGLHAWQRADLTLQILSRALDVELPIGPRDGLRRATRELPPTSAAPLLPPDGVCSGPTFLVNNTVTSPCRHPPLSFADFCPPTYRLSPNHERA